MRAIQFVCLAAVMVVPSLAMAELPFSRQGLAQVEATLDFCSQTNPQTADKFKDHGKRLVRGLPSAELEGARKSEEYQMAYESMTAELGKVAKDEAARACAGFFEEKQ